MQKKNYELSERIARDMTEAIDKAGCDVLITECSACKMQIEHLTGKKAVHPIKLLAKSCGL